MEITVVFVFKIVFQYSSVTIAYYIATAFTCWADCQWSLSRHYGLHRVRQSVAPLL